jgi:hypothetical protein
MDTTLSSELSAFRDFYTNEGHSIVTSLESANIQSWVPQHHSQVEVFTRQSAKEQANIRQELIDKLLESSGKSSMGSPKAVSSKDGRAQDHLSKVQIRLIDSILRCRNHSEYAWNHTNYLEPQTLHTAQASDASRSMTLWESSKNAPDPMFQSTAGPVLGRSTTQADLKPSIAGISTTSGQLCYPEPLKAVSNGISVSQCPYCAQLFDESFTRDPQRWRFDLSLMNLLSQLTVVAGNISIKTSCHIYARSRIAVFLTSVTVQQRNGNHTYTKTILRALIGSARLAAKGWIPRWTSFSTSNRIMITS